MLKDTLKATTNITKASTKIMGEFRAQSRQSLFPNLGLGLGLRSEHFKDVLQGPALASWFEVISENQMGSGGRPKQVLEQVRARHEVALHGVSLSIGSVDPIDRTYLRRLKELVNSTNPAIVSDHLCWTGVNGENLHDLLPLPYTEEVLNHLVIKIDEIQNTLQRRILLENVSSYITYKHSELQEWDFLAEIARRADCGILLDINNVYVSSVNHGFDPLTYLDALPGARIGQIHLAGHSTRVDKNGNKFLIDTHDHPVCDEVWALFGQAVQRFGPLSTMIEWDAEIPDYKTLEAELAKAAAIQNKMHARTDWRYTGSSFDRKNAPSLEL